MLLWLADKRFFSGGFECRNVRWIMYASAWLPLTAEWDSTFLYLHTHTHTHTHAPARAHTKWEGPCETSQPKQM